MKTPEYSRIESLDLFSALRIGTYGLGSLAIPIREYLGGKQRNEQADRIEVERDLQARLE